MKDQYFGDINDYRKYGILRALQSKGLGTLLVAWMLTPDDSSRDGEFRSYLEDPATWKCYDPELFAGLRSLMRSAPAPKVSFMEKAGLLPDTVYYSEVVPDKRGLRDAWRYGLLDSARNAELVFVDPDNGIEVPSKPIGRRGSSKYVTWQEIQALWQGGCSILIYQHFPRERREVFCKRMVLDLKRRTGAGFIEAFHTPRVLLLLAAQERHQSGVQEAALVLQQRWTGQIVPIELANPALQPTANPLRGLSAAELGR